MKKFWKKSLTLLLASMMIGSSAVGLSGCFEEPPTGGDETDPFAGQVAEDDKTQIYVFNFNGGYGSDWLVKLIDRFEDEFADYENPEDSSKVGVQVMVDNNKTNATDYQDKIATSDSQVFFTEYANYFTLLNFKNAFMDITDVITEPIGFNGETGSIADKMNDQQRDYYGTDKNGDGYDEYYGIPHYSGFDGLAYNHEMFEKYGFFLVDVENSFSGLVDPNSPETWFVGYGDYINDIDPVSPGPDGIPGNEDDGLPRTFEEFKALVNYIKANSKVPFIWNGTAITSYFTFMQWALAVNQEGKDQAMLNYTLDGTATTLGSVDNQGNWTDGADKVLTGTPADIVDLSKQLGKYYSVEFVEYMLSDQLFKHEEAGRAYMEHTMAQEYFVRGGITTGYKEVAMLVDGCWWQSEAKGVFTAMVGENGDSAKIENRDLRWMPLPKYNEASAANNKYTLVDSIYSLCFMNKTVENDPEYIQNLCKDFIRFAHTDESLVEFTTTTNTTKALNYTLDNNAKNLLTPYGKSLVSLKERADIVYPFSGNSYYIQNQSSFTSAFFLTSSIGGATVTALTPQEGKATPSAKDYFDGIKTYWEGEYSKLTIS